MDLDQFIEFLIEEGEINAEVIKKSLEVNELPILRKILLKIEGQTILLENVLRPKNEGEFVLAKGELLRICILNDKDVKQQGIKFIDDLIKKVREKFNLYPSEKKVIKNKNSNKLTSKGNETFQESEEDLSSLIKQADEFFKKGECHHELEEYEKAIENCDDAIKLNPNNQEYFAMNGLCYYELEEYEKAIDYYWKAICLNPNIQQYFAMSGFCYYKLEEYEKAIENFDDAIKLEEDEDWFFLRGLCYYELDEYEKAIENLDNAISFNPEDVRYFYYRGLSLYFLDEEEKAIENFDIAISFNPEDDSYFYYRGLCFFRLDEYEKAIENFDIAISFNPENDNYFYYRGLCLFLLDENEEAIENFDIAISFNPNEGKYFYYRSRSKIESTNIHKIKNIIEDLNMANNLSSLVEDLNLKEKILITRFRLNKEKGEYEKCIKDLSEAISLNFDFDYISERILMYKFIHQYDKAIKDIIDCCLKDPQNHLYYKSLLIDKNKANPYTGYMVNDELKHEKIRKSLFINPDVRNLREELSKQTKEKINKQKAKYKYNSYTSFMEGDKQIPDYLEKGTTHQEYKDIIINLFGVDGEEDFKKACVSFDLD